MYTRNISTTMNMDTNAGQHNTTINNALLASIMPPSCYIVTIVAILLGLILPCVCLKAKKGVERRLLTHYNMEGGVNFIHSPSSATHHNVWHRIYRPRVCMCAYVCAAVWAVLTWFTCSNVVGPITLNLGS